MAEVVVIVPTRGRPQALSVLAARFAETTESYRILLVVHPDDRATWDVLPALCEVQALEHPGSYAECVNAGIEATDEPLVLVGADDIRPHPGWFATACGYLSDTVGFVSLNDLGNPNVMAGDFATLPLVSRRYIDSLDGPLYHEGYQHGGCDVDASLEAKSRRAFAYAPDAVMEHLHPDWGKGEPDETYEHGGRNRAKRQADRLLLRERWPRV